MRLMIVHAVLAAALMNLPAEASCPQGADTCPPKRAAKPSEARKAEPKRFEPYDPGASRSGTRPGFVDVGGGTELRVGGRSRSEYQYTR